MRFYLAIFNVLKAHAVPFIGGIFTLLTTSIILWGNQQGRKHAELNLADAIGALETKIGAVEAKIDITGQKTKACLRLCQICREMYM